MMLLYVQVSPSLLRMPYKWIWKKMHRWKPAIWHRLRHIARNTTLYVCDRTTGFHCLHVPCSHVIRPRVSLLFPQMSIAHFRVAKYWQDQILCLHSMPVPRNHGFTPFSKMKVLLTRSPFCTATNPWNDCLMSTWSWFWCSEAMSSLGRFSF